MFLSLSWLLYYLLSLFSSVEFILSPHRPSHTITRFTFDSSNWVAGRSMTMVYCDQKEYGYTVAWCPIDRLSSTPGASMLHTTSPCYKSLPVPNLPDWVSFGLNTAERHEKALYLSSVLIQFLPESCVGIRGLSSTQVSNFFFIHFFGRHCCSKSQSKKLEESKRRGADEKRKQPQFPFRDWSQVIWRSWF